MSLLYALLTTAAALPSLVGDFDHDGRQDVARVEARADGQYLLRVARGADPARPVLVHAMDAPTLANFHVGAAQGGRVATACGKGLGPRDQPCPRRAVTLTAGDLTFGTKEASMAVAQWNGKTFVVDWLSD